MMAVEGYFFTFNPSCAFCVTYEMFLFLLMCILPLVGIPPPGGGTLANSIMGKHWEMKYILYTGSGYDEY